MVINLCILLLAFGAALLGTPLVIRLARRLRLVDEPGLRKVHKNAIPRVGGIAIVFAVLVGLAPLALSRWCGLAWLFDYRGDPGFSIADDKVWAFMGAGIFMFLVGLYDDVRNIRARYKLLGQVAAALILCAAGIRIETLTIPGLMTEPLVFGPLSWPITLFWVVGITNAVNLIDGLDGLAAGISLAATLVILAISLLFGQAQMVALSLAMAGAIGGFLVFNFNPAKVFMGDCGSLFLGFMVAGGSVLFSCTKGTFVGLTLPALALGVPIFDTFFCMLRRYLTRRSPFAADRKHIHHKLLKRGLDHRRVVLILYAITLVVSGAGIAAIVIEKEGWVTLGTFAAIALGLVLFFRANGMVNFTKGFKALSYKLRISRDTSHVKKSFQDLQLRFMEARDFQAWWEAVITAGQELDFSGIKLQATQRDGSVRTFLWQPPEPARNGCEVMAATVPVRQRRQGCPSLQLEVAITLRTNLETGGTRLSHFTRLLEEWSLAELPADGRTTTKLWRIRHGQEPDGPAEPGRNGSGRNGTGCRPASKPGHEHTPEPAHEAAPESGPDRHPDAPTPREAIG